MNQEVTPEVIAETPAPEQVATAAPESDVSAPENAKQQEQEAAKAKTFTQEELDAAIGKRLAREQRKWEREQAQRQQEHQAQAQKLSLDQFESPEAYAEALAERKAAEKLAQREQHLQQAAMLETYHEKEEAARDKYDDFEQVAYNPNVRITDYMAESIRSSEIGPDIAYFLGSNPKDADRISRLSPLLQAKEIGKIEAKLASEPPAAKKTSKAPAPIKPVSSTSSGGIGYDLDDPRSFQELGPSAWIEARKAKAIADAKAGRR